jgi:hypothetical protein
LEDRFEFDAFAGFGGSNLISDQMVDVVSEERGLCEAVKLFSRSDP